MQSGRIRPSFVILVASGCDATAGALGSVLEGAGYSVVRARSGREAYELASVARPSGLILDDGSGDVHALEMCRILRGEERVEPALPVFILTSHALSREDRISAYDAGAWDVFGKPLDAAILLAKMQTFLRAYRQAGHDHETSLWDGEYAIYSRPGLMLRACELWAMAARRHEPLACVSFAVTDGQGGALEIPKIAEVVDTCRHTLRGGDVLGRTGRAEFAIVAPATDDAGAHRMLDRLRHRILSRLPVGSSNAAVALPAHCGAIADCTGSSVGAADLILSTAVGCRAGMAGTSWSAPVPEGPGIAVAAG